MVSILIDDNLLLRSYHVEDAQELFRAVEDSRQHLRPWLVWVDSTIRPEHSLQFIQQSLHQQHSQEALALGIFHNRKIIGGIGMHQWNHYLKKGQLGYWIAKEYEGKGIVHKCMVRFIDFLFDTAGLNKVEIRFIPTNTRSAALAERLGCKVEGVLRDSYIVNGGFTDLVVTGLLKSEWKNIKK
ncbi:MAG: GNAT family N-acetyltransferase [Bacteroidetes bacterium]|nr:GNAT family N-acetyltransferase [Bacteroidota bacterium]